MDTLWALLFTSGTSAAPKAVRCTQRRLLTTGNRMTMVLDVGPDDVGYAAMPLFHSNSLMVAWLRPWWRAPRSLARRFSASRFLPDVRRYGATWFNYTGKPLAYLLATPEQPDDADNTLRIAFGNEGSPQVVEAAAQRFGVAVVDVFGSTEGAIALDRPGGRPRGSVGRLRQGIKVVDPDGNEARRAVFDGDGRWSTPNDAWARSSTPRRGPVRGLLPQRRGHGQTTRKGWYWSGDLGYVDDEGWVYFAGRTSDWLRVDGENFPAAPSRPSSPATPTSCWPRSTACPTPTPATRSWWRWCCGTARASTPRLRRLARRPSRAQPKWRPRTSGVRDAAHHADQQGPDPHARAPEVPRRPGAGRPGPPSGLGRGNEFRSFGVEDEASLRAAFVSHGRLAAWDL